MRANIGWKNLISSPLERVALTTSIIVLFLLSTSCSRARTETEPEAVPETRIDLSGLGLPRDFFTFTDQGPRTIIGYRFVVWLNPDEVVVGFNTSPHSRTSLDRKVDGSARLLAFSLNGDLKSKRDIPYLADGNGELVAEGEASAGPRGTIVFGIQSVNLDPQGRNESKSGVLLLDADLRDVARIDRFLEQLTFVDHALVFQEGFTLGQSRTYDILNGSPPVQTARWQQDWPIDSRDRKFGEHGLAYITCQQELKPNEYVSTKVVYAEAKQRCKMTVERENQNTWEVTLKDGETAVIVGLLLDGSVVAQIRGTEKGNNSGQLVIWKKDKTAESLPWIPQQECVEVVSATTDMSRYAALATCNYRSDTGRWVVFDKSSATPIVNRRLAKNARAALSPDGLHYASFESGELRIYSLQKLH